LDIRKINEQRSDLARKEHAVIIEMRILAKIKSHMITLAAWRKILKQAIFCDASELMPLFCHNIFQHIHFQSIVKINRWKNVIKFMKFYAYIFGYTTVNAIHTVCQR